MMATRLCSMFVIEDEIHAEWCGKFATFVEAMAEITARSRIPWDSPPNVCPCASWRTCGREYSIVEYDRSTNPWTERGRTPVLRLSHAEVRWEPDAASPKGSGESEDQGSG